MCSIILLSRKQKCLCKCLDCSLQVRETKYIHFHNKSTMVFAFFARIKLRNYHFFNKNIYCGTTFLFSLQLAEWVVWIFNLAKVVINTTPDFSRIFLWFCKQSYRSPGVGRMFIIRWRNVNSQKSHKKCSSKKGLCEKFFPYMKMQGREIRYGGWIGMA